jgi:hypothetical protein
VLFFRKRGSINETKFNVRLDCFMVCPCGTAGVFHRSIAFYRRLALCHVEFHGEYGGGGSEYDSYMARTEKDKPSSSIIISIPLTKIDNEIKRCKNEQSLE